ncbi:MAG TPA: hypothetical protein VGB96_05325, partial [Archangium sp.]
LHATPAAGAVLREQVSAVGLALRVPALGAFALLLLATALTLRHRLETGEPLDFRPELTLLPGLAGLLLPLAVWKGEPRFGPAFFWTLPVERRQHALTKVFAGWLWLMAAVALFLLWMLGLTLLTGGNVLGEVTLNLVDSTLTVPGVGEVPQTLRAVQWKPRPVLWLVSFTSSSALYLFGSAMALGLRHPLRWVVGFVFSGVLVITLAQLLRVNWFFDEFAPDLAPLVVGRYGLDALLTARAESLSGEVRLPGGEVVNAWEGLPDVGDWALATLLWTGAALALLWAAASRHREQRRR